MPSLEMSVKHDEMAVRMILWQYVQRFGFAVVAHVKNGSTIEFHPVNALYTATGKKSDSTLNIAKLCLLLHNSDGWFIYRNVIRQQLVAAVNAHACIFKAVIQVWICSYGVA